MAVVPFSQAPLGAERIFGGGGGGVTSESMRKSQIHALVVVCSDVSAQMPQKSSKPATSQAKVLPSA